MIYFYFSCKKVNSYVTRYASIHTLLPLFNNQQVLRTITNTLVNFKLCKNR